MADFDIDLDGVADLQESIEDLKDDYADDVVYVTGTTVEYGIFLEMGTEKMPPYPWFRPAVREFQANPEQFIFENTDFGGIDEFQSTQELVQAVAFALENQMTDNVSAGTASDRSPGTDPEHPQRDTGTLANSIQAVRIQ